MTQNYNYVTTRAQLHQAMGAFASHTGSRRVAVDTETTGLNIASGESKILLLQLYIESAPMLVIDCRSIPLADIRELVNPILGSGDWLCVGHNLYFDWGVIYKCLGIEMTRMQDTLLSERLLTAGLNQECDLESVTLAYLGVQLDKEVRKQFIGMPEDMVFTDRLLQYAAEDVEVIFPIADRQVAVMRAEGILHIAKLEFSLIAPISYASLHGVLVDYVAWREYLAELEIIRVRRYSQLAGLLQPFYMQWREEVCGIKNEDLDERLVAYEAAVDRRHAIAEVTRLEVLGSGKTAKEARVIYHIIAKQIETPDKPHEEQVGDGDINIGSTQQLIGSLLKAGVPVPKTREGTYTTGSDAMEPLSEDYELVAMLKELREVTKLVDAFGESVLKFVDSSGRIHPKFNQLVSTGRMSCIAEGELVSVPGGYTAIENIKVGDVVYTFDAANHLTLRKVTSVADMGMKSCIAVNWSAKISKRPGNLICTPEHRVKTVKRGWVSAADLQPGEPLVFAARSVNSSRNRPSLHWTGRNVKLEQIVIKEEYFHQYDGSTHIHHIDENCSNNRLSNLSILTPAQHTKLHNTINISSFRLLYSLARAKGQPTRVKGDFSTFKKKCQEAGININAVAARYGKYGTYLGRGAVASAIECATADVAAKELGIGTRRLKSLCVYYGLEYNHRVVSVTPVGLRHVYDIGVEGTNCFVASEICVHNCSQPNLQQVPGTELGKKLRKMFIAPPGSKLISCDFSQIELRIIAAVTKEPVFLRAFGDEVDMHGLTALSMMGEIQLALLATDEEKVAYKKDSTKWGAIFLARTRQLFLDSAESKEKLEYLKSLLKRIKEEFDDLRKVAKMINFGVAYGLTGVSLGVKLNIPVDVAKQYVADYDASNTNIIAWKKKLKDNVRRVVRPSRSRDGAVHHLRISTTLAGRNRYFRFPRAEDYTEKWMLKSANNRIERQVGNHVIQGGSADITKTAIHMLWQKIRERGWSDRVTMILFVHDEIVAECPDELVGEMEKLMRDTMILAAQMYVPGVPVDAVAQTSQYWAH